MADKIIKVRIDVKKLNKEYFFKGEKGTYADVTILYNEEPDQYGANGMVVQDVPKAIYEKDKTIKGNILGNCKDWATQNVNRESIPNGGTTTPTPTTNKADDDDDLPF